MGRLISLLIVVIDILAIVDILRSNKATDKKILWVIVVLLLPILGPILYYIIEKK
ncbi:PLDc N-terminal domain-containing protein [Ohtaekwangia sp.]|uniref:PLDc N-terminal domain-containing protein n=1 Tax=Ohtaekwangia sp. TaxID=2066019 RepID=UPI002F956F55